LTGMEEEDKLTGMEEEDKLTGMEEEDKLTHANGLKRQADTSVPCNQRC